MAKELKSYNIFGLREKALMRVPKGLFEFVDRGTEDEVSLRNNRAVFEPIRFKPRTMVDVSKRSLGTNAVMVARSTLHGVAAGGYDGAVRALEIYREEITRVMAPIGCNTLAELGPQYLKIVDPTLAPADPGGSAQPVGADANTASQV